MIEDAQVIVYEGDEPDRFADFADADPLIEMEVSFDSDRQRALEDARFWAALSLTAEEKMDVEGPLDTEKLADALPIERAA